MSEDPEVAEWRAAERAQQRARRRAIVVKVVPALVVVGLLGGILGAIRCNDVRRREETDRWIVEQAAIPVPPENVAQAKEILRQAITAQAAEDDARGRALAVAYDSSEPQAALDACPLPVVGLSYGETLHRTAFTFLKKAPPSWNGPGEAALKSALADIDRRVQSKVGSGRVLGDELVQEATALAKTPPPPFDFQLVIEQFIEPNVAATEFSAGLLAGTLLAYDRTAKKVVCGAHIAGTSSGEVSYVKSSDNPAQMTETPSSAVWGDLFKNLLTNAPAKLVVLRPQLNEDELPPAGSTKQRPR